MKKLVIFTVMATMIVSSLALADLDIKGKIELKHKISDSVGAGQGKNIQYTSDKVELYLSNDKAMLELTGTAVNQAYIKTTCPVTGGKVKFGLIQTLYEC